MMLYSSKDDFSYFHHETCVQSRDWQTFFPVQIQRTNVSGFEGHMTSVTTTKLCQ